MIDNITSLLPEGEGTGNRRFTSHIRNIPYPQRIMSRYIAFSVMIFFVLSGVGFAQTSSLSGSTTLRGANGKPLTLSETSRIYASAPKKNGYTEGDIIRVRIKDVYNYSNTADNQRKKNIKTKAELTSWIKWPDLLAMPMKATDPLPGVGGTVEHKTQNQGTLSSSQKLEMTISCRVTSICDNGNLIIEGHNSRKINEEERVVYISGEIDPNEIGPEKTIDSERLADIVFRISESGNVVDTYRRPWATRWIEQNKPF